MQRSKRFLSLLMAVVFCLSLMPVAVAADENELPEEETISTEEVIDLPVVDVTESGTADAGSAPADEAAPAEALDDEPDEAPAEPQEVSGTPEAADVSDAAEAATGEDALKVELDAEGEDDTYTPSGTCGDHVTWTLKDGVLTISGEGEITYGVWYEYSYDVYTIVIEEGVTSIYSYAFQDFFNVTEVYIPSTITYIGEGAFDCCYAMETVYYCEDADVLADWYEIEIGEYNDYLWYASDYDMPLGGSWGDYVTWTLKDGVLTISGTGDMYDYCDLAPEYRSEVQSVVIEPGVTSIGAHAFQYLSNMTSIDIPEGVARINYDAFYECGKLAGITLPASVESIELDAFWNCDALAYIDVDEGNRIYASVDGVLFNKELTELLFFPAGKGGVYSVPEGVTSIRSIFGCPHLTGIVLPASMEELDSDTLSGNCFESIDVAAGNPNYTSVDGVLFSKDGKTLIAYPGGRKGAYTIPEGVEDIGWSAFSSGSDGLTKVTLPDSMTSVSGGSFYGSSLTELVLGKNVSYVSAYFYGASQLERFSVDADNQWFTAIDGVLFSKDGKTLVSYPGARIGAYSIPDGVTAIGDRAFEDQTNLTSVTIPASVTTIGSYAFAWCYDLETVICAGTPGRVGGSAFEGTPWLNHQEGLVVLGTTLLKYTGSDSSVVIPGGITSIGSHAFSEAYDLVSITIPTSVTSIGEYAFESWGSLREVNYSGSQDEWYDIDIADGNEILWSVLGYEEPLGGSCGDNVRWRLLDGVLTISGEGAMEWGGWFEYAYQINSVVIGEGVTGISDWAFEDCYNMTEITLPSTLRSIGYGAFDSAYSLAAVNYPGGADWWYSLEIESQNEWLWQAVGLEKPRFGKCGNNTAWKIDGGVLVISGAGSVDRSPWYEYAREFTAIVIEDGVTSLPDWAFENCYYVTSVTIPGSMQTIEGYAFNSCYNLNAVIYSGDDWYAMTIEDGNSSLWRASGYSIRAAGEIRSDNGAEAVFRWTLEDGVLTVEGKGALDMESYYGNSWSSYQSDITAIKVGEGITAISDSFRYLYSVTSVELPSTLKEIGDHAFSNCSSLADIAIPAGVEAIGKYAFYGCYQLQNVAFPASLTAIGDYAFNNCSRLTGVTIGKNVTSVGAHAFEWCSRLQSITIQADDITLGDYAFSRCYNLESVIIGEGLTAIGAYAFSECDDLRSVSLPLSVETIGDYAFEYCEQLKTVQYAGEEADWNAIAIGGGNEYLWLASDFQLEAEGELGDLTWKLSDGKLTISGSGTMPSIGNGAWNSYAALIKEIVIEDGVTSICDNAFSSCGNVTSITIPTSVTEIGMSVCSYSGRLSVTYAGTAAQWSKIDVGMFNSSLWAQLKDIPFHIEGISGENITWVFDEGTLTITGSGPMSSSIWTRYVDGQYIKTVVIGDGITSISDYAFGDAYRLTSITLPTSLETIGDNVFGDCWNLSTVVYEGGQKGWDSLKIGSYNTYLFIAGEKCGFEYTISGEISETVSWTISGGTLTISGTGAALGSERWGWRDCSNLIQRIVVEDGITALGSYMFESCYNASEISFPQSLQAIGADLLGGFYRERQLTVRYAGKESDWNNITIRYGNALLWEGLGYKVNKTGTVGGLTWTVKDDTLTITGSGAIPDYLSLYGPGGYYGDGGESNTSYAPWIDYSDFISAIVLDKGITSIGTYAFDQLDNVTYVKVPEGVTEIAGNAFNMYSLASIWLPASLESISREALNSPRVVYYSGSEEDWAKVGVTGLSYYDGPGGWNWIDTALFIYNYNGETVELTSGKAGENAAWSLNSDGLLTITGFGAMYDDTPWSSYYNIYSTVTVADEITSIPEMAFAFSKVTGATLPSGVTEIVYGLFMYSTLKTFDMPETVVSIEEKAFYYTSLEEIELPEGLTSIGSHAFEGTGLTEIEIPDGVSEIAYATFRYCGDLNSVTIPTSVKSIDGAAFVGTQGGDVYYGGTADEWAEMDISAGSGLDNYTIHFIGLDYAVQMDNNSNGSVAVNLSPEDAAALVSDSESVMDLVGGKTIDDPKNVEVEVVVQPVKAPETAAEQSAIDGKKGDGAVLQYLDLSVQIYEESEYIGNITQTPETIRFTIVLTDEQVKKIGDGKVYVIRVHNGTAETLPTEYSPAAQTVTFQSDLFSTYAIAFDEEAEPVVIGDINDDGDINTADLIRMVKVINKKFNEEDFLETGDFNGDGHIKADDLIRLLKYVNGQVKTLL